MMLTNTLYLKIEDASEVTGFIENYLSGMMPQYFKFSLMDVRELFDQMDKILDGPKRPIEELIDYAGYNFSLGFEYQFNNNDFFFRLGNEFFLELAKYISEKFSINIIFFLNHFEDPALEFENGKIKQDFRSMLEGETR